MNETTEQIIKPDRKLGDEWESWTGDLDESKHYQETAGLFAKYTVLTLILTMGVISFILYMIEPRLRLIHTSLVVIVRIMTIGFITLSAAWIVGVVVSALTGKYLFMNSRLGQVTATAILPIVLFLAKKLGTPRDKLGNSFIRFSNAVVKASHKPQKGKTIILLPRCLTKEVKKQVQELGERTGVKVFSATGGGQARRIISEERPTSVIGVACERDLMSGIHDVAPKMPTLGVTNIRPEGPCKNTIVDMDELKKAIEIFTEVPID